jgi:hypothetical protein
MGARMTTIEIDERTAEILKAKAEANGLSLEAYLRLLAETEAPRQHSDMTAAEIDAILDELAQGGEGASPLPASFSREDIYFDHD